MLVVLTLVNSVPGAKPILYVIFAAVLVVPLLRREAYWGHGWIIVSGVLLGLYNLLLIFAFPSGPGVFYNGLLAAGSFALLVSLSTLAPSVGARDAFVRAASTVGRILIAIGAVYELVTPSLAWDTKAGFLFLLYFFVAVDERLSLTSKGVYLLAVLAQLYAADDRGYLLGAGVVIVAYTVWPYLARHPLVASLLVSLYFVALAAIPAVYVWLAKSRYRADLDAFALRYTQGRFFSGRDVIWDDLFEVFHANPFFGGGHAVSPFTVSGLSVSAHNTYVSVMARTGLVGLVLLFTLFLAILARYASAPQINSIRWGAAYTIAILFKQSTELSLVGNNMALAIASWVVVAFGLIATNISKDASSPKSVRVLS